MLILYIFIVLALAVLIACRVCYSIAFRSPDKGQNELHRIPRGPQYVPYHDELLRLIDAFAALPYEPVSIVSQDELELRGKYFHVLDGAPLCICCHGYRGLGYRDFCGGAPMLMELGFDLLLIDERAHGDSQGHCLTMGVKERFDVLSWIEYARCRFGEDVPIVLCGVSMGAATVLMASGLELPENVKGILADCPYSNAPDIIRKGIADRGLPPWLLYPFVALSARLCGGFRLEDGNAAEAVKRSPVPIVIVHGEDDRFVPCDMSRAIAAECPENVTLHTFPDAGHGMSGIVDPPRYRSILRDLAERLGLTR